MMSCHSCRAAYFFLFIAFLSLSIAEQSDALNVNCPVVVSGIRPELSKQCYAHRSASDAGIEIKISSRERGLGAFSKSRIPMGTLVGNYNGELLTLDEVKARYWGKHDRDEADVSWIASRNERAQSVTGDYLLEMPNGSFIDAEDADVSSWCRFMNHAKESSKECNVKAFHQLQIDGPIHKFPFMYTIRDVEMGDELCWDYGDKFYK